MPPKLLNTKELAETIDESYQSVLNWTRQGLIPSIKTGNRYYFNLASVCRKLKAGESQPGEAEVTSCA